MTQRLETKLIVVLIIAVLHFGEIFLRRINKLDVKWKCNYKIIMGVVPPVFDRAFKLCFKLKQLQVLLEV